ncbi:MAG: aldo/keto reductase [Sphingomonadaceae bacterium]|nr:aldo/keto reductase [Sphingomonadaceae bacterium]
MPGSVVGAAIDARRSGTFAIGGDVVVNRLGFGAMRITGERIWGEPEDRPEAVRVLRRLPDVNVNLIDTADSYGPFVSEDLIAEALYPYDGLMIATKGGLVRPGVTDDGWPAVGDPHYLGQCVRMSLRRLKIDRIDLWQLHRIDPKVPRDDQFGAIAEMIDSGLIRHAGLSQVSVDEIIAAGKYFPVATVQNRYNVGDRADEDVLLYCEANGIGFMPWSPIGGGALSTSVCNIDAIAERHRCDPRQVAIAWLLKRSSAMLPIPGTSRVKHLDMNVASVAIDLSDEDIDALSSSHLRSDG